MGISLKYLVLIGAIFFSSFSYSAASGGGGGDKEETPSFGLFPPAQYPPEDATVLGLRSSLGWARHKNVFGLDINIGGGVTTGTFAGAAFSGFFNNNKGNALILITQSTLGVNRNMGKLYVVGAQIAGIVNITGKEGHIFGLQAALVNTGMKLNIYGVQAGLYNEADNVYGFQIGILNKAQSLHGIQIGLLNIHEKGMIKYFPVINVGF